MFGADDEKGHLDKYSIRQSVEDGTTVPLHYALAPNDLQVDRETLEKEFLGLKELEGVSDVEELNTVLERAVTLKNMMKNPDRVKKVAKFVADHFKSAIEPMGYKAFLVAVDRQDTTKDTLTELEEIVRELRAAQAERDASDLTPEAFAVFWFLQGGDCRPVLRHLDRRGGPGAPGQGPVPQAEVDPAGVPAARPAVEPDRLPDVLEGEGAAPGPEVGRHVLPVPNEPGVGADEGDRPGVVDTGGRGGQRPAGGRVGLHPGVPVADVRPPHLRTAGGARPVGAGPEHPRPDEHRRVPRHVRDVTTGHRPAASGSTRWIRPELGDQVPGSDRVDVSPRGRWAGRVHPEPTTLLVGDR